MDAVLEQNTLLEEDTALGDDAALAVLQRRIDLQTEQLTRHARELSRLREELDRLNDRLEAHEAASANAAV